MPNEKKIELLEQILKEKQIPYKRNNYTVSVPLSFQEDLLRYAKRVGLSIA